MLGAYTTVWNADISFVCIVCLSVRRPVCVSTRNSSASTTRIFMKVYVSILEYFFENMRRKFKFHQNLTRITGTLHDHLSAFVIISQLIVLRMRNNSKLYKNKKKNIFYVQQLFFPENRALYGIKLKFTLKQATKAQRGSRGIALLFP
jgi:hypothetical protein